MPAAAAGHVPAAVQMLTSCRSVSDKHIQIPTPWSRNEMLCMISRNQSTCVCVCNTLSTALFSLQASAGASADLIPALQFLAVTLKASVLLLLQQYHCKMRFIAYLQVLFLLDVDFMVSSSLNELQHSGWVHSVVSQGVLVVIPAFEPVSNDLTSQQAVTRSCTGGPLPSARYNT